MDVHERLADGADHRHGIDVAERIAEVALAAAAALARPRALALERARRIVAG
jgi:hypothetical protein